MPSWRPSTKNAGIDSTLASKVAEQLMKLMRLGQCAGRSERDELGISRRSARGLCKQPLHRRALFAVGLDASAHCCGDAAAGTDPCGCGNVHSFAWTARRFWCYAGGAPWVGACGARHLLGCSSHGDFAAVGRSFWCSGIARLCSIGCSLRALTL